MIDEAEIKEQLRKDKAFYGEIVKKQPNSVTIKEIDEDGDTMQLRKMKSEEGVSENLYTGQRIYA